MKKVIITAMAILMATVTMKAQTYTTLWKQVKEAEQQDLPQTGQQVLTQIVEKATHEQNYGQLLKAELLQAQMQCEVAPDSLRPVVDRLTVQAAQAEGDHALQAVWHAVLGYIYQHNPWLDPDRHEGLAHDYFAQALARPDELAQVKATAYEPFVVKGQDSRFFGDDLLSLIGCTASRYDVLRNYYQSVGNRRATLLAANFLLQDQTPDGFEPLNKSRHIQRLDSLISAYSDLPECGEVAISRYDYMDHHTDATAEQKWQYINMALERWGAWQHMNTLRNAQRNLTNPQFSAEAEHRVFIPQREQALRLTDLRGLTELTLRVYLVKADGSLDLNPAYAADFKKLKPLLTALPELTQTRKYVGKRPYELFNDSLTLPKLPVGVYMIEMESQPASQVSRQLLFISDVRVITQAQPLSADNTDRSCNLRIVAVNATTGQPLKVASVKLNKRGERNKAATTYVTDEHGECLVKLASAFYTVRASMPTDNYCPGVDNWFMYRFNDNTSRREETAVYTDRAIYRPGQTVQVAAIVYESLNGRDHHVCAGKEVNFRLYDANNKQVSEQKVVTDDFGTAATSFTLPVQGLTGSFSVRANGHTHRFQVEEYKRPAFVVDIPRVALAYEEGDTVVARGTVSSYAGVPVQGAQVKYTVVRRRAFWWMSFSRYWDSGLIGRGSDDEVVAQGETVTDDQGQFLADMPMVLPQTQHPMFYTFVLTADVTDQAGETHQGSMSLPIGNRPTAFTVTLPEKVVSEQQTKVAFHLQNVAGIDMEARVRYRFDGVGRWLETTTNQLVTLPALKSGKHKLQAEVVGDAATEPIAQEFVVFSLNDSRPATDTRSWFFASHDQFPMSGEPVTIQAGSSDKDVHMVYSVISGNKVLESGRVQLNNELLNRKFNYKDSYGNGLLLTFAWMKEGKTYTWSTTIRRPMRDVHLDMKWTTFRNRLTPGQQEEWTLSVKTPDGKPAAAQLMATLYDKSLDQLTAHSWSLTPTVSVRLPVTQWQQPFWGLFSLSGSKNIQWLSSTPFQFNSFDESVFPSYWTRRRMFTRNSMVMLSKSVADTEEAAPMAFDLVDVEAKTAATGAVTADSTNDEADTDNTSTPEVQIRENLQETAFFMPQLVADSSGVVKMKFTLPESLTTWRFLGVAHTRDMMYGTTTDEAVARKEVMIQPNMPRFLRQGDHATISARVVNMSEQAVSGTAMLQLLDPETEKVVYEQKQQVSVEDSSTVGISFAVQPELFAVQASLYIARVSVVTPAHTDGEQHYLPLLSNMERVNVTVPFTQNEAGTKTIDLTKMFGQAPLHQHSFSPRLTVEYTNNPAWLMIQALPTVAHPHDGCAVCQITAFYANSIGRHILKQNPTAKHVFEQWKQEESTAGASSTASLQSSLQKNQELKDLLLTETPWVMDADREEEQKSRLADFFDSNLMDGRIATALDNLCKLQDSEGAWSWWPGMKGSDWMTLSVSELLVRLNAMTGQQDDTREMLEKAFEFLSKDIVQIVEQMKKDERNGLKPVFPSRFALEWLYICAIDGRSLPAKVSNANDYLKNLLKKDVKNQTIMEKALSAIVLNNKTYVKSLKEWTVYREDMGRYYDTQRAGYSWRDYTIPTQVAVIEALKRLTPQDTETISEMQRWLLQQKRNQAWDTPLNSADAIYAFLDGNSQALEPQPKSVLAVDHKQLNTSQATAGMGYVKQTMDYTGQKTFTAEKTSTGTSWGAVYAQFMQHSADVTDQQSGLAVKRELMVKRAQDSKYTPVAQGDLNTLKVGDRMVVRITIEADRNYDFVQLTDKRAACMEPVVQLSGYNWRGGYYCNPKDCATNYFFDQIEKGRHIIETEYYMDRAGTYQTGTCTVQCAYSPEFHGTTKSITITVQP